MSFYLFYLQKIKLLFIDSIDMIVFYFVSGKVKEYLTQNIETSVPIIYSGALSYLCD